MLTSDPWIKAKYDGIKAGDVTPVEAELESLKQIEAKAESVGATIEPETKSEMSQLKTFYETASQRSVTMVNRVLALPGTKSGTPVAMIIGAGHSDKVAQLLRAKDVSFVLFRPLALNPQGAGSLSLVQFERKARGGWVDDGPLSLGRILSARKKPQPVVELKSAPSFTNFNYAAHVMAKAARAGRSLPDNTLKAQLAALPGVIVDWSSVRKDGYDVIFAATVTDNQGTKKKVWARVGTAKDMLEAKSLEDKLLAANLRLAGANGGGNEPPNNNKKTGFADPEDPKSKKGASDQKGKREKGSERDGKESQAQKAREKAEVGVSHAGIDTLVIFSENREKVESHATLSY